MRASRILAVAAAAVLLIIGACGDDDTDETTDTPGDRDPNPGRCEATTET
jgi:hypothetical protein